MPRKLAVCKRQRKWLSCDFLEPPENARMWGISLKFYWGHPLEWAKKLWFCRGILEVNGHGATPMIPADKRDEEMNSEWRRGSLLVVNAAGVQRKEIGQVNEGNFVMV